MKKITFIILLSSCYNISFGQTQSGEKDSCDTFLYILKPKEELLKYIANPCANDSTCITEISKAKSEIANGKITFCMSISMSNYKLRQEKQLRQLCKSKGLNFEYEIFTCFINSGQTNGCYGLYMDKIIANKFGRNFKEILLRQADSIYISSNPTVSYWQCDTLPRLFDKNFHQSTNIDVPIKSKLFNKLKISKYGYYPQVEIGFYIDTAGVPSNYFLSRFILFDDIVENNKFKSELIKMAFDTVKQLNIWKPGQILNQKVKSKYYVTISFINENKE